MFVQDFIRIDEPLARVVGAFEHGVLPRFDALVRDAWQPVAPGVHDVTVPIAIGARRDRSDAVAYSISWPSGQREFPAFDADIEFAAISPNETHVEFAGQSRFPFIEPWSAEDRRSHRQSMTAVGDLLRSIAQAIQAG